MNMLRKLFGSSAKPAAKVQRPDSPTNKIIKKIMFYSFLLFTSATIISKKHKTQLILTFMPTQQNLQTISRIPILHQSQYYPVYYMFWGPIQRIYQKYFQDSPYVRPIIQQATNERFQLRELQVHDKYVAKANQLSLAIIITGTDGASNQANKFMLTLNSNGFRTFMINIDDVHSHQRLQSTIQHIKSKYPNRKMFAVGLQYGANLLVNFAAHNNQYFKSIISVGNPLDLEVAQKKLQKNFLWKNLLYKDIVKGRIAGCQKYKNIMKDGKQPIDSEKTTLFDIDSICHSRSQANKSQLSSIYSIPLLTIPFMLLQSQQSPFTIQIQSNQQKLQNQKLIIIETQKGGHLEWFQSMKKIRWANRLVVQYFKYYDGRMGFVV